MIDSLFDRKTAKEFDSISKKKAELTKKEKEAVNHFLCSTSSETIYQVLDLIGQNGHPNEIQRSQQIKNKYESERGLEFDDIVTLDMLYKSNYKNRVQNKDDPNE